MFPRKNRLTKLLVWLLGLLFVAAGFIGLASAAPGDFPEGVTIPIPTGSTVSFAADKLYGNDMIRSTTLFKTYVSLFGRTSGIQSGNYYFGESESALRIAYRMVMGQKGVPQIKVTIPEGLASPDVARAIKRDIPTFDDKGFLKLARPLEGFLFPDTYFFDRNTTPQDAITAMRDNFNAQTRGISVPNSLYGKTFHNIITMASLVEEEATSSQDRRIIAGILWKRMADGMALQVDAPFFYIFGKTSAQLTVTDLATSSPYNLYKYRGLPPTPIDNPGITAIQAAVTPIETKYWFFLSGNDGTTHFAETFEQHKRNIEKYIR